jgi:nicotinate-nucleotide adenylyltransferase
MVELAVAGESRLRCDRRELDRAGPSYTYDSLLELREELGEGYSLTMVVGCDALLGIASWHRWRELLDLAHITVMARPGWDLPASGEVSEWLGLHRLQDAAQLREKPCGGILVEQLRPLDISSTEIRALLTAGQSARYLLSEPVLDYIQKHGLYK